MCPLPRLHPPRRPHTLQAHNEINDGISSTDRERVKYPYNIRIAAHLRMVLTDFILVSTSKSHDPPGF